ncbi:S-adenosylmethionine carrier 1, chloroplastic/mitochondrial-like [Rosa chinensis]|uniref:S-adenosylmethionine carrier 1, chloroplastic/mitochondrial-like n=1 Tax=Rosa chinensis TaxID=74649 RepID=UPI001AD9202F|nr:S-adenosylmethionine carrier 1, chloroplastic/mitochondrial-like [Rosa chinensis]
MFPENLSALAHFVVRQRMQTGQFTSFSAAVRFIAAKEGFKGLYAAKRELNDPENAIIGAFAGALTGVITTPLNVIKTRLMVQVRPSAIPHDTCLPLITNYAIQEKADVVTGHGRNTFAAEDSCPGKHHPFMTTAKEIVNSMTISMTDQAHMPHKPSPSRG